MLKLAQVKRVKISADIELKDRLVGVQRVVKVTKGGRAFGFSAIVVVGDEKNTVGIGLGKSKDVSVAIQKAIDSAKKNLVRVPIYKGTIPHEQAAKFSFYMAIPILIGATFLQLISLENYKVFLEPVLQHNRLNTFAFIAKEIPGFYELLKKFKPDIVHVHSLGSRTTINHIKAIKKVKGLNLIAISDLIKSKRELYGTKFKINTYKHYFEMLKTEKNI